LRWFIETDAMQKLFFIPFAALSTTTFAWKHFILKQSIAAFVLTLSLKTSMHCINLLPPKQMLNLKLRPIAPTIARSADKAWPYSGDA
jgi:hypothetical protein